MPAPLWRPHMSKLALLVACSLAIAAQGCSTHAQDGEGGLLNGPTAPSRVGADSERLVEVERVRVYVKDGRLQAFVEGPLGDGCTSLKAVTQTRAGNEVRISLTSVRVGEVCTMMLSYLKRWSPSRGCSLRGVTRSVRTSAAYGFNWSLIPAVSRRSNPIPVRCPRSTMCHRRHQRSVHGNCGQPVPILNARTAAANCCRSSTQVSGGHGTSWRAT
jgi:hypothetical protein